MEEPEYPEYPRTQPLPEFLPPVRTTVTTAGVVLAVVLIVFGLAVVGCIVLFFVALSNFGSNK